MAKVSAIKVKPAKGRMPTLQFCRPIELHIDPAYQRDIQNAASQAMIRKIATAWDWDLCQPLVVARRQSLTEQLYVIDGQHRLAAARLRGDIEQLPCVIVSYSNASDEAAAFVTINQQRKPLNAIELFKAALASGEPEAIAIDEAMRDAGLSVSPHLNHAFWKPGMVSNIGGIRQAWRKSGAKATATAFRALSLSFGGQVLQYAGTIFPGIVAVCADEIAIHGTFAEDRFEKFQTMLARRGQGEWRTDIVRAQAEDVALDFRSSSELVLRRSWIVETGDKAPAEKFEGKRFCQQCEIMVAHSQVTTCKSRFCSFKEAA
jgi:hypothetical protein